MKKLLIVESPSKIKTISKFLPKDFTILSTVGHIKDLPTKKLGVTINGEIKLEYVVMANKDKVISDIVKEAKKSDEVYLAPDPDREGEIIAWHVAQEIEKIVPENKIFRIKYNEITKPAVLEALEHPEKIDMDKVAAQQARRVLDRWVGYEVSPILWRKITKGLSAGRVQSVALRLICDREEAIRAFKVEEYWTIDGTFLFGNASFIANLVQINNKKPEIKNEKEAQEIVKEAKKSTYVIESIQDKTRTKNPYPPFMTSTLQQAAYNQLGFSAKKTMEIAQKLYEGIPLEDDSTPVALITYMRTDSLRIADSALTQTRKFIDSQFGKDYLPPKANEYSRKKEKAQDAHEAIRPIDISLTPEKVKRYIPADAIKLYDLIWKRFIASQMKPALYAQRQVTINSDKFVFRVTGSTLIFDGFLKVYNVSEEDEKEATIILPESLKEKSAVKLNKLDPKQHFTQPPPRYSEATLIKELEKEGIGRPSTYASILNTIRARSYTKLDKKRFVPTELGFAVTNMLVKHLPRIMDVKFTANMEEDLDKIANAELKRDKVLKEFYKEFQKELEAFKGTSGKAAETTEITCPKCKKNKLKIRFGKTGEFLGCSGYPDCDFTSNFTRDEKGTLKLAEAPEKKLLDEKCPKCGKPLRIARGRFGEFKACSGYPECKYIHQEKASFKCPKCKKGDIVKRKWRGGTFWGCGNYPKCKFAVFGEIEEKACPQCKLPFLVKQKDKEGNIKLVCSDKECGYKEDKKE